MNVAEVAGSSTEFEAVLTYIKEARGFDFTGYKRTSLARRIGHRMGQVGIERYDEYIDRLQASSDEFAVLFNTILINVTGFFRDPEAWEVLRTEAVPAILAERDPEEPVRVWSAGCASGQEAYSLAMVFAEVLGPDQFRQRVKIYATDVDEDALGRARQAAYTEAEVSGVPADLLERYFERHDQRWVFRKDFRRSVIFGRNDLVQDAPISRIDLLVCRNTLMYLNAETQSRVLGRFHFALAPQGLLFLGKAEMLLAYNRIFDPLDLKRRLFRKTAVAPTGLGHLTRQLTVDDGRWDLGGLDKLRDQGFSASPVPQVVVTGDDIVALANQQAEHVLGVSHRDIGRPLRDLEISYRPVELRNYTEQARVERRSLRIKDVEWSRGSGDPAWFDIHVNPLVGTDNGLLGVSIAFHDVTAAHQLYEELERANRQLEAAYQELQSTNEELETTNEELQSTVEELETTNEELQSTNEELETINEELQSTNDELQTINEALRERSGQLDELKAFMDSILGSIRAGVVVVDDQMRVLIWNGGAADLWGMRRDEVEGEHLLNLDIGLPFDEIRPAVRKSLTDPTFSTTLSLTAINRRGRHATIRAICGPLLTSDGAITGAILIMEQQPATD